MIEQGATILDGAVIEKGAIVSAGTLVPPGKRVAAGQVWAGAPAAFVRPVTAEDIANVAERVTEEAKLSKAHDEFHTKPEHQKYLEQHTYQEIRRPTPY
jgi:carbonic anhydrase/acetyltransferase-like protein (isoleucine patch superfamily)